ncbi:hypothetical protein [Pseudomonas sp. TMP25]|uniref:hypothetical protein n=1 Tax=Pseudomonas sp. TMP25 TaxID=3136561 RepID=UPI003100C473
MSLEGIWKRDHIRRKKDSARKARVNCNWPIHAEIIANAFKKFSEIAARDGVYLYINEPCLNFSKALAEIESPGQSRPWGQTTLNLSFGNTWTGEGVVNRTEKGTENSPDMEIGAALFVHHSPAQGVIQVFLEKPYIRAGDSKAWNGEGLLVEHTLNTDDLTLHWAETQINRLLTFNRVESVLLRPSQLDKLKVRAWHFLDIRNRRGYLKTFQHIFTQWELVVLAGVIFIAGILFSNLLNS